MEHQFTLMGVIWMLVLGPAVGNYACSVIYRLPLGRTPFECHPFCGHCDADLKPIDLFPILSWCCCGGACRYCGGKIPALYAVVEIACGLIFVGYFLQFGISEYFLLYTAFGVFTVILAGIQWQQGWIAESIFGYALTFVALARTLGEGTIYGWVKGAFLMAVCMIAIHWLNAKLRGTRFDPFTTPWIWWLVLMGALLPMAQWRLLTVPIVILLAFFVAPRQFRPLVIIPIAACALYLPLLLYR